MSQTGTLIPSAPCASCHFIRDLLYSRHKRDEKIIRCSAYDLTKLKLIHLEPGVDTLAYGEADHLKQTLVCHTLENQEGEKANHGGTRVDLQGRGKGETVKMVFVEWLKGENGNLG